MSDNIPDDLYYSEDHEWVRVEGNLATVGITHFASEQLGDVTQVDLPKEQEVFKVRDIFGTVESVKAVSDLFAPVSGKIVKVNTPIVDSPDYIREDPYDSGWMVQMEMSSPDEIQKLMRAATYEAYLKDQET
jgi:glycine cleavage system H protein